MPGSCAARRSDAMERRRSSSAVLLTNSELGGGVCRGVTHGGAAGRVSDSTRPAMMSGPVITAFPETVLCVTAAAPLLCSLTRTSSVGRPATRAQSYYHDQLRRWHLAVAPSEGSCLR